MKNYLLKEFKLAAHPTTYIFMILPLMLLIPNYPYTVTYFYFTLAVFFTCMLGRECHDIQYAMMLPVAKSDIVKGRMLYVVILELISLVLSIPIVIIRQTVYTTPNLGGCDANLAIFGFGFLLYAIFNFVFFIKYYKNVLKPGVAFVIASAFQFIYVIVLEILDHTVPLFTEVLDTQDSVHIPEKMIFDVISIAIFVLVTFFTYKKSVKSFTASDL